MADFYKYTDPLETLNTEDLMNFFMNFNVLRSYMATHNIAVGRFKLPMTGNKDTPLINIKTILNNIEYNLDILNTALPSEYYGEAKKYDWKAPTKDDIWRWVQVTNDLHSQLFGEDASVVFVTAGQQGPTDSEIEDMLFDIE